MKPVFYDADKFLDMAANTYINGEAEEPPFKQKWFSESWVRGVAKDFLINNPNWEVRANELMKVFDLLESPLEFAALLYLTDLEWDLPIIVSRPEESEPKSNCILIKPQYPVGQFRLDFLFSINGNNGGRSFAIELDGDAFHQDQEADAKRDEYLIESHSLITYRIRGKHIFGNLEWAFEPVVKELKLFVQMYHDGGENE